MSLHILKNLNINSYNLILVKINFMTKIVYYKLFQTTIYKVGLVKIIISIAVRYKKMITTIWY